MSDALTRAGSVRRYSSAGGVVVGGADEKVLVLLRPERAGPDGRPEVRLPKGHIESGEDPQGAALREVREEAGLSGLEVIACLGHEPVEFDWQGIHYIRDETYYLMAVTCRSLFVEPEKQFKREWLDWASAQAQLTFEAEREWLSRAQRAWEARLDNIAHQEPNETYQDTKVQQEIPVAKEK